MSDVSYYTPSAAIHSFLMFAPFLAMYEKRGTFASIACGRAAAQTSLVRVRSQA
jgi:hypothetical protein